jgi:WD40 repeat protein
LLSKPIDRKGGRTLGVALSSDGKTLLTVLGISGREYDRSTFQLHDTSTGKPRCTFEANGQRAYLSGDGGTVLLLGYARAELYDAATGKLRGKPMKHPHFWISRGALSLDGTLAVTGDQDGVVRFHDAQGTPLPRRVRLRGEVHALAFSRDGKVLITGGADRSARLWDAATGNPLTSSLPHPSPVWHVALSPDGRTLATVCSSESDINEGEVRLWDAQMGRPIGLPVMVSKIQAVGFSPDGATCLVPGPSGMLSIKVPQPLAGPPEQLALWAQVRTGLELDDAGAFGALDGATWRQARERLGKMGGPPVP